jgi:hypothetical protein
MLARRPYAENVVEQDNIKQHFFFIKGTGGTMTQSI